MLCFHIISPLNILHFQTIKIEEQSYSEIFSRESMRIYENNFRYTVTECQTRKCLENLTPYNTKNDIVHFLTVCHTEFIDPALLIKVTICNSDLYRVLTKVESFWGHF